MSTPHPSRQSPFHTRRGMTLVEVMMAMLILGLVSAGVVASLTQSRRLTEGSIAQASAQAAVESYMEQIENMLLTNVTCPNDVNGIALKDASGNPTWAAGGYIPTQKDEVTADALVWSNTGNGTPTIPKLSDIQLLYINLKPGTMVTPAGVVDNLKEVPANPTNPGSAPIHGWADIWPCANLATANVVNASPNQNNLHLDIWVWVTDLSNPISAADSTHPNAYAQQVYGITIIYTWQFWDGANTQYYTGILHTVRSAIS